MIASSRREASHRPSAWVQRYAREAPTDGTVLDLACGNGRHGRLFLTVGLRVTFIDRVLTGVADLSRNPSAELLEADIERGPWPLAGRQFDVVVVVNYLSRPLMPAIFDAVAPSGLLIYETYAQGHERVGRHLSPLQMLRPGELLDLTEGRFSVLSYRHGRVNDPQTAVKQMIAARKLREAAQGAQRSAQGRA